MVVVVAVVAVVVVIVIVIAVVSQTVFWLCCRCSNTAAVLSHFCC